MSDGNDITRREALARTAILLGGTLAASTIAGAQSSTAWLSPSTTWRASTLADPQLDLVAAISDHIIPRTDTPGARDAGVQRFVDVILTKYYAPAERQRFLTGLADIDAQSRKAHGKPFLETTPAQQVALLTEIDASSYPPQRVLQAAEPLTSERKKMVDSLARQSSTSAISDPTRASADAGGDPVAQRELEKGWFFRRMKELTLLGYYTSNEGAMKELKVNPMGIYRGDIPYRSIGHSWA
jgi:gluconate 2-dehydrogenase gamma chain